MFDQPISFAAPTGAIGTAHPRTGQALGDLFETLAGDGFPVDPTRASVVTSEGRVIGRDAPVSTLPTSNDPMRIVEAMPVG